MRPETLALLAALWSVPGLANPLFIAESVPEHVYSGSWQHFVGGGLAAFDCNGDALPELYAAGGETPAVLLRNLSRPGDTIRFRDATPDSLRLTAVTGAYPLDIDSDGHLDLVVLRAGQNRVLRGGPDCRFTPWPILGANPGAQWTTAFSATWEAGQTLPTLAFGNYVDRTDPAGPFRACDHNLLYRPTDGGYAAPLPLRPGYCALSMLFSDWGRHGRADLRISNDRHYYVDDGQEQLWAMETPPRLYTAHEGWQRHSLWGMGIASRDLTGDGLPDVFLTSMGDQRLQILTGPDQPLYRDVPFAMGTTAHRPYLGGDGRPSTGWHVGFGDVQNDGRDDIFVTKGNVEQMPDSAMADPNNLLIQQPDGRFVERGGAAGLGSLHRGRGAVLADLNADGLLDVAVVNRRAPLQVWRNLTPGPGNWISLLPGQPAPNVNAVGAWIELQIDDRIIAREITVGGGHAGGSAGPQHFGLGDAQRVRARIIWPNGAVSDWVALTANSRLRLQRDGSGLHVAPY